MSSCPFYVIGNWLFSKQGLPHSYVIFAETASCRKMERKERECPPYSSLLRVLTKLCAGRFDSNVICKLSTFNGRDVSYSYIRKFVLV